MKFRKAGFDITLHNILVPLAPLHTTAYLCGPFCSSVVLSNELLAVAPEIPWAIASYLPCQNDIYALVRTNRRLHQSIEKCLHYRNAQYYHGAALSFAAKHSGLVPQIQNLLV